MIRRILLVVALGSLLACGGKERAGGTTVETTNGIAGVVEQDGNPQKGVRVLVVAEAYLPKAGEFESAYLTYTDRQGRFSFPLPPKGRYRIIARDTLSGQTALTEAMVENSGSNEISIQLQPSGTLQFPLQGLTMKVGDYVALPGSDVVQSLTDVDLQKGKMTLTGIPAGKYGGLFWTSTSENNPPFALVAESIALKADEKRELPQSILDRQSIEVQLSGILFDSLSEGIYFPTMLGNPSALVVEAKIRPVIGLLGGEVVSLGDHVGFRIDANDSMVAVYAYSSFTGPTEWMVLSGGIRRTNPEEWVQVALVDDPTNGRWELWLNGVLQPTTPLDSLKPISWDKGDTETWIGRNSRNATGYKFRGEIEWVRIQAIPSTEWDSPE